MRAEPFTVSVDDAVLDDLRERLRRSRWPNEPASTPWELGTTLDYMQRVVAYWLHEYDWRKAEATINRLDNYRAIVDGLKVHFILERGSGSNPRPLIMTHGWPGSIIEFLSIIEPLAHPERFGGRAEDAFTVVVPSMPGYGFSQAPEAPMTLRDVGRLLRNLMVDHLGFDSFFAQGGDQGGIASSWMAFDHPENVTALHLNSIGTGFMSTPPVEEQTAEERDWVARNTAWRLPEEGYRTQQGTRPQTLAYGLTDSPVGLAAWILEKFHGWTVPGENIDPPFPLDELLTNVMLYWIAGPNAASWYYISFMVEPSQRGFPDGRRVEVPTAFLSSPRDTVLPPPDRFIQGSFNMVRRTNTPGGGHFAALEQPDLLVEDVRTFFRAYSRET